MRRLRRKVTGLELFWRREVRGYGTMGLVHFRTCVVGDM